MKRKPVLHNQVVCTKHFEGAGISLHAQIMVTSSNQYNARVLDVSDILLAYTPFRDTLEEAQADGEAEAERILQEA